MHSQNFDFNKLVIEASQQSPVVVDFWASWCAPCRVLGPILEKLAEESAGKWQLVKVDTEAHPQLSADFAIRGIPAVKMFYKGDVIADFVGALPEVEVRKWLQQHIPSESQKLLEAARTHLEKGNNSEARALLVRALDADQQNYEAKVLLAELSFEEDAEAARDLVNDIPEEDSFFLRAEALRTLSRLMNERDMIADRMPESKAGRSYLAGIDSLRKQDYEGAITHWIEAIIADKTIDEDGPRKACVAIFTWLGQNHQLTRKHHRAFTSALF